MNLLAPSLLAADFSYLGDELKCIERGGADYLHFDVMDGHFVSNISFGITVLKSIRRVTPLIFDAHLMVSNPARQIEPFALAGADIITVHYEAADDLIPLLNQIRALGKKAAFALNPGTPADAALPLAEHADMILLMSVVPGKGGQTFMPETLSKAEAFADYAARKNLKLDIEMDGGINLDNLDSVLNAGVNVVVVAGSSIFFKGETEERTKKFKEALKCV